MRRPRSSVGISCYDLRMGWFALTLATVALAHSPGSEEAPLLCLSDGQVIRGEVRLSDRAAHVDLRGLELRVPWQALGEGCPRRWPFGQRDPRALREVHLLDGQRLLGRPSPAGRDLQLYLLDGQRVILPRPLVVRIDRVQPEQLAPLPADQLRSARARARSGTMTHVLGAVVAVAGTGMLLAWAKEEGWRVRIKPLEQGAFRPSRPR